MSMISVSLGSQQGPVSKTTVTKDCLLTADETRVTLVL